MSTLLKLSAVTGHYNFLKPNKLQVSKDYWYCESKSYEITGGTIKLSIYSLEPLSGFAHSGTV